LRNQISKKGGISKRLIKEDGMVFQKDKGMRAFNYLKVIVILVLFGLTAGSLSCTSPTGSTASSGSGTGVGWTVTVSTSPGSPSTSRGEVLGVIALVKDRSGGPAIKGTSVCFSALRGGFVTDTSGSVYVSFCESTTNDVGQVQATYTPLKMMEVEISPGVFKIMAVPIDPGPDTISASALGAFGSTTIQVLEKTRVQ
jgi:hypothetical protein